MEDAEFPTSKSQLVREQGWKLFDKTTKERVRTRVFLEKLPEGAYRTLDDVLASLKGTSL
jgi:hypothetical protein